MSASASPAPSAGAVRAAAPRARLAAGVVHPNEEDRLESLWSDGILDTPAETVYDDLGLEVVAR